jgi:protein MpaA
VFAPRDQSLPASHLTGITARRAAATFVATIVLTGAFSASASAARSTIGHSVRGRPIVLTTRGSRSASVHVLIVGCIHGNECAGRAIVSALRAVSVPPSVELLLVPTMNPDGARANTRQNVHGVDLNRNFARGWEADGRPWDTYYSGPRPFSEPETRVARRLIRNRRPQITIWYHQHMSLVAKGRRHIPTERRYADEVGLPLRRLDRLAGTASRWQNYHWRGHLSFVVELPAGSLTKDSARRHARAVLHAGRAWAEGHR